MNEKRVNDFDSIAWAYDSLARLVFGKSIVLAQLYFLDRISQDDHVLIVGGGTGWILREIGVRNSTCKITYVESSEAMLRSARKFSDGLSNEIVFVNHSQESIDQDAKFDVVITNFFLDLFSVDKLDSIVERIKINLKSHSLWIATDFNNENRHWQKILLKIMYLFFRIVSNVENRNLPDWHYQLQAHGLQDVESKFYFRRFIRTALFKRSDQ